MTKPPPRNLTPPLCEHLREKMLRACHTIAQSHGLVVKGTSVQNMNLRYGFNFTIDVGIPLSDGTILEPGRALFEVLATDYGLSSTDFGREFRANGEAFRITGLVRGGPNILSMPRGCPIAASTNLPQRML